MDRSLTEGEFYAAYEVSKPVREATSEASSEALSSENLAVMAPKSASAV